MARFLIRLANNAGYTPRDVEQLSKQVRTILGSKEGASHFRVSSKALEFNLFARNEKELNDRKSLLGRKLSEIIDVKPLDSPPTTREKMEVLREGIELFNQERYWECHEVLEQIWHPAKGEEREIIQGLILTAAAFVHRQKGEDDVCLSILRRAKGKIGSRKPLPGVDLERVKQDIDKILDTNQIEPFKIQRAVADDPNFPLA